MLHRFEPGLPVPQTGVLTTRLIELYINLYGDTGLRSVPRACKARALQLSYTPIKFNKYYTRA